ncbi:PLP-dependent aminotransferase family protein [Haloferula chungangensis]|uniref:PLP-dependent aminotransferase family protein n=1 Tax=Haloferula chungangensis TaxID=1048331 RepID=A0ABW2L637_9BACT
MSTPLYQELADRMNGLIQAGTFTTGSKLPSVRRLSREQGVSITTAMEAYGRLEDLGLIESRARSGYFVRPPVVRDGQLPKPAEQSRKPIPVQCPEIFQAVMEAVSDRKIVSFGAAVPGDEIVPHKRLNTLTNSLIRRHGAAVYRYSMAPGRRELRTAISRRLLKAGMHADPDDIVTTHGATEALALAVRAVTRPGDVVAVETPTYFGILHLLKDLGLNVVEIPMDAQQGIRLDALEELSSAYKIAVCIVQPSFQNPLGSCMSDAAKKQLIELAVREDFVIIEDDLYGELCHAGPRPSALTHFDRDDRVIHCGSVSKWLAPGLRIGWVISRRFRTELRRLKSVHYLSSSALSELVVAEYFSGGGAERHLRRVGGIFGESCARMREAVLAEFPAGTRINQPRGGFVLWVELPEGHDSEKLAAAALNQGISLIPGPIFSATCGLKHCLRLSCGELWSKRSADAVRTLGRLAAECRS